MDEITRRNQLIEEIERLKAANKHLEEEIDKIKQKDEMLREKKLVGEKKKLLYWRMPAMFLNTVFYTRKKEIAKDNHVCMMDAEFGYILNDYFSKEKPAFHMAALCEDIIETGSGFRLALRDPYKRFLSNVLDISYDTACKLPGRILYLDFRMSDEEGSDIFIRRWKSTALTLHGYKGVPDPVSNPIACALLEFKEVDNENDAIQAVTILQNYFRMKMDDCKVARVSPTELRILRLEEPGEMAVLYCISFRDGEFWMMSEKEHFFSANTPLYLNKEFLGGRNSETQIIRERWAFKGIKENAPEVDIK